MRVKATVNLGTNDYPSCPLKEGETADVSELVGGVMVARGHAVEVLSETVAKLVAEQQPVAAEPTRVEVKTSTPEVPAVKTTKAATGRKS